jgi:isoquinoline 1-oxidoreductase alpha subunit
MAFTIKVNGVDRTADVDDDTPLLWVLRDVFGMTGTKFGCGMALCGACTVHLDGMPTRSCITTIDSVSNAAVTTIEAIGSTPAGQKIQKAWLDLEVVQCGYCQSGQIMSATALLASNPQPNDADIDDAMSGNICRCGTYVRIPDRTNCQAAARASRRSCTGEPHNRVLSLIHHIRSPNPIWYFLHIETVSQSSGGSSTINARSLSMSDMTAVAAWSSIAR